MAKNYISSYSLVTPFCNPLSPERRGLQRRRGNRLRKLLFWQCPPIPKAELGPTNAFISPRYFHDAAALGSTFLTLGASAEVAGTATNAMIRELAIATQQPKRFQAGLKALGREAEALQNGMAKNATGTLQQVLDAINKLPQADQLSVTTQLFGKEFGDAAAKLANNVQEYRRQLELANAAGGKGSMQREADTGVRAYYYEVNSAEKKEAIAGGGDNLKELRHSYTDQASALRAARAEWRRVQRGTATLSYTLAKGRPELVPDQTYTLAGIKAEITEQLWVGGNIRHSFSPEAFTTSLELESKLPDEEVADLAEGGQGNYTGIVAWYRNEKTGGQKKITKGDQSKPRRLIHLYESKANAERAAEREWRRSRSNV